MILDVLIYMPIGIRASIEIAILFLIYIRVWISSAVYIFFNLKLTSFLNYTYINQ